MVISPVTQVRPWNTNHVTVAARSARRSRLAQPKMMVPDNRRRIKRYRSDAETSRRSMRYIRIFARASASVLALIAGSLVAVSIVAQHSPFIQTVLLE